MACTIKFIILLCTVNFVTPSQTSSVAAGGAGRIYQGENADNKHSLSSHDIPSLQDLVKNTNRASVVYEIATKYGLLSPELADRECSQEIVKRKSNLLTEFYVVKITLKNSITFMANYFYKRFSALYDVNAMQFAREMYKNNTEVLKDQETYIFTISDILKNSQHVTNAIDICVSDSPCGCISSDDIESYKEALSNFKSKDKSLREFIIFGTYVDPVFRVGIGFIGFVLNAALLCAFYREASLRSANNTMIINLTINNVLMCLVYLPMSYVNNYQRYMLYEKNGFTSVQATIVSVNALVVLFLNAQRYFDVSRILKPDRCHSTPKSRSIVYTVIIWVWSLSLGIFFGCIGLHIMFLIEVLGNIIVYLLIFSVALVFFNSMTARKLYKASQQDGMPMELQNVKGSSTVVALTILFYAVHIVFFIQLVWQIARYRRHDYFVKIETRITIFITNMIFSLYPSFTVLVLLKTSNAFRKSFKKHLFCWCSSQEYEPCVTMSSVQNADS